MEAKRHNRVLLYSALVRCDRVCGWAQLTVLIRSQVDGLYSVVSKPAKAKPADVYATVSKPGGGGDGDNDDSDETEEEEEGMAF